MRGQARPECIDVFAPSGHVAPVTSGADEDPFPPASGMASPRYFRTFWRGPGLTQQEHLRRIPPFIAADDLFAGRRSGPHISLAGPREDDLARAHLVDGGNRGSWSSWSRPDAAWNRTSMRAIGCVAALAAMAYGVSVYLRRRKRPPARRSMPIV